MFNSRMDSDVNKILHSTKSQQTTAMGITQMDLNDSVEHKKVNAKEYTEYNFIYMQFKQNCLCN